MPIFSMTGFARTEGFNEFCSWTWELRSVNGKGLEIRSRLPNGFEKLELTARDRIKKSLHRGNISLFLNLDWVRTEQTFAINEDVLNNYLDLLPHLSERIPNATPVTIDGLLSLKGIIEPKDETVPEDTMRNLEIELMSSLDRALIALQNMRADEGAILGRILNQQLDSIALLCQKATEVASTQPNALRECLKKQVNALLDDVPTLSPERLEQEVALLLTKADVSEELDRIGAHTEAAKKLLGLDSPIGRKLDFLCQEFNREANTLCSKSNDMNLTRIGLDMKILIEQSREQIQNIE